MGFTVLDDQVKMYADHCDQDHWKYPDVSGEKALQGERA